MSKRPNIFQFHDYRMFLKEWFAYRKGKEKGFSLRSLAGQAGVATGYLPMVLNGKRALSDSALKSLLPYLGLSPNETSFFENMVVLGTSDSNVERVSALDRMKRFGEFKRQNPNETEAYEYLTHWYFVAIREMATLKDFKLDPQWIQENLTFPLTLTEIKAALNFLIKNSYIVVNPDGTVQPPTKYLDCSGGIYRVALADFHREIYSLAVRSIESTPSEEREIQGQTFAISSGDVDKAKEILREALEKIRSLGQKQAQAELVYHFEMALFPMTSIKSQSKLRKGSSA